MSPTDTVSVYVVTPTRNNLDELTRCLASLQGQTVVPARVYVCSDGSTDGTVEALEQSDREGPAEIRVLTHPENAHRGRPATRNLALAQLDSEYVWYVDSDMVLEPDALERHLELVESQPCLSQGQVVYANARDNAWAGYLDTRAYHRLPDRGVVPFTWFSAANALVRTAHVKAIGGFDARFAGYGGEDFDFAHRLTRHTGEPIINNRRAIATTVEDKSIEAAMSQFEEYGAGNLHLLEALHPEMPRTFELERLESSTLVDRLFRAMLNRRLERVVDVAIRYGPGRMRNQLLNYKVIAAVWRGYGSVPLRSEAG
jgi:glycosyltransferase involved in cell wall biosynthesis